MRGEAFGVIGAALRINAIPHGGVTDASFAAMLVRRPSLRAPHYDYRLPGAYFVTIVAAGRRCIFGHITAEGATLSPLGQAVHRCWQRIGEKRSGLVTLDEYVVMPNHLHGLLMITASESAPEHLIETAVRASGPAPRSLGAIVGQFKAAVSREAREIGESAPIWQRNYHERVIRTQNVLDRIRQYIRDNPERWRSDRLFPAPAAAGRRGDS